MGKKLAVTLEATEPRLDSDQTPLVEMNEAASHCQAEDKTEGALFCVPFQRAIFRTTRRHGENSSTRQLC